MEQIEIWKDISGYEGLYQVSNKGRVKSLPKLDNNNPYYRIERILIPVITTGKYISNFLYNNGVAKVFRVHRLVGLAFIPNPDNKPEINHKDGNKQNNNDWNLEWNTRRENDLHARLTGLIKPCYNSGAPKVPIKAYNYYTNEFVGEYESQSDCVRKLKIKRANLFYCLSGKRNRVGIYRFEKS